MADLGTALSSEINVVNTYFTYVSNAQYYVMTFGYVQSEIDVSNTFAYYMDNDIGSSYNIIFNISVDGLVDPYTINPEFYQQRV